MEALLSGWEPVARSGLLLAAAAALGLVLHFVAYRAVAALGHRRPAWLPLDGVLLGKSRAPMRLIVPLLTMRAAFPLAERGLPPEWLASGAAVLYVVFVLAVGWLLVRLVDVTQYALTRDLDIGAADNLAARRRTTQVGILRRLVIVGIVLLTAAAVLLRFEGFREIGAGLLASAGIAGIVLGFAAQRTLGNLIAGIQIAITQPIRIEDVVVIEGEWGRIEEITLTYVVVRIWDLRRLVVPIGYFIEKPFTNWTRTAANLLGTAFFYVDYSVPVEAVREELHRVLQSSEWWDGEAWALQVTDLTERTVQLRALMSAANSGDAFNLRCDVRERLTAFLQAQYPDALPTVRARIASADGAAEPGAEA
ncbi:MAG: mechanosensitive ion channel family protein [Rhodothermales bacterium]